MNEETIYARVSNGLVVEYPVYPSHIATRGHPLEWYIPCVFDKKPTPPDFYYAKEYLEVKDTYVAVHYSIEELSLDELLKLVPSDLSQVSPDSALVTRIRLAVRSKVQKRLDDFAAEHDYGDEITSPMVSACSYAADKDPVFAIEAAYCIDARSSTWRALYSYWDQVFTGAAPLPKTYADIEAVLPALEWPDVSNV